MGFESWTLMKGWIQRVKSHNSGSSKDNKSDDTGDTSSSNAASHSRLVESAAQCMAAFTATRRSRQALQTTRRCDANPESTVAEDCRVACRTQ